MSQGDQHPYQDEGGGFEPAEGQAKVHPTTHLNSGSAGSAKPSEHHHSFVFDGSHADTNASTVSAGTAYWSAEGVRTSEVPALIQTLSVEQLLVAHQTILQQLTSQGYQARAIEAASGHILISSDDSHEHHHQQSQRSKRRDRQPLNAADDVQD